MEATKVIKSEEKFKYQDSEQRVKVRKSVKFEDQPIVSKRLFSEISGESTDEESKFVTKKVKSPLVIKEEEAPKPTFNYGREIFLAYQAKEYDECQRLVNELIVLPIGHPHYKSDEDLTEYKIILTACWTFQNQKKERTFKTLSEIIDKQPKNSFARYGFGLYQYNKGDFQGATESFKLAVDFSEAGRMKKAMEYKEMALNLNQLLNEAKKQFNKGNCSKAVDILNKAALIDAENDNIMAIIKDARDTFVNDLVARMERETLELLPDKFKDAERLILSCKFDESQKLIKEIFEEEPKTAKAIYIKALSEYMIGNLKASAKLFEEALKLDPAFRKATDKLQKAKELQELLQCASEEMVCEKYQAVVELLTKALKIDNTNRVIIQASHFQRSLAYFNLGQPKEAFADYQKFEDLKPLVGSLLAANIKKE